MSYILCPLIYICNRPLSTGIFPSGLKNSQVHPIYKKGDKTDITNYRPISLFTSFSKIFEKVIFNRLHTYISVNNILDSDQYGFRKNSSTETAAFNLTSNILQALDSKKMVGGIFCDLTKAFEVVDCAGWIGVGSCVPAVGLVQYVGWFNPVGRHGDGLASHRELHIFCLRQRTW
jgi:hypothetical protein